MKNLHKILPDLDIELIAAIWVHLPDHYKYYRREVSSRIYLKMKKDDGWDTCFGGHSSDYIARGRPPIDMTKVVITE
jgi:hypothetical protein